jgi:molybdate transport system substrate-binding protein
MTSIVSSGLRLAFALLLLNTVAAGAAEITVGSSTGVKAPLSELVPQFEKATGHKVNITFDAANLIVKQIDGGKTFDVVIVTPALIKELVKQGKVVDGSTVNIARAGIGVAIKSGAPKPDISTPEAFKKALLDAKAIAFTTAGQSGQHFASVIEKLGIADQVKAKAKTLPGGAIAEFIVKGEADMAVQLIPELMAVSGVEVVGPLPSELQAYVVLTGGVGANAADKANAEAFIKFLSSENASPVIKAKGLEPG